MSAHEIALKTFRHPRTEILRFTAKGTMRTAAFWAVVFGGLVASKSIGYATVYPTQAERTRLAVSIGNNVGLNALFGTPTHLDTVTGYTAWYTLAVMVIFGSIWAALLATKKLRGDEDAGRWELMLTGQTTAGRAAANAMAGLAVALGVMYVVLAAIIVGIGKSHDVNYSASAGLFLALAAVSSAAMFMAIGAVASQLMPTRARAAGLTVFIFGIFFIIRAAADTTSFHWLLNFTPLGWVEKMQPLYGSQSIWLLPVALLTFAAAGFAVWLAGNRDLGESTFADKATSKPRYQMLNSPLGFSIRLSRDVTLAWLGIIAVMTAFFGILSKSAASAFAQRNVASKIDKVVHVAQSQGALIFLGVIFFVLMTMLMAYVAASAGMIRQEESEGYLDNLLVRRVSRSKWLVGRILIVIATIFLAGVLIATVTWLSTKNQHLDVTYGRLFLAGMNVTAPALFTLGLGIFGFGFLPRFTTIIAYGAIAWSFLLNIISAGINLNHYIIDSSVLNQIAFAPATNPKWTPVAWLIIIGAVLAFLGIWRFNKRDLQSE